VVRLPVVLPAVPVGAAAQSRRARLILLKTADRPAA